MEDSLGEGADGDTQPVKETLAGHEGSDMTVQTSLQGIAKRAARDKQHRFGNLYTMLNEEMLHDSWRFIRKDAAYGVDRVSAEEYEQNLANKTPDRE